MAYCRWSSMNHACDLYCYQDFQNEYVTHVAWSKITNIDEMPNIDHLWNELSPNASEAERTEWAHKWVASHNVQMQWLKDNEVLRKPLDLPHAGETFSDPDAESFKERLIYLRELGYRFPDGLIDMIDEEIAEQAAQVEHT